MDSLIKLSSEKIYGKHCSIYWHYMIRKKWVMKMNDVQKIIQAARSISRLTALEVIEGIFEDFIEFHGDRRFGDDPAIVGGIASLEGMSVTVIGTQKGHDVTENV